MKKVAIILALIFALLLSSCGEIPSSGNTGSENNAGNTVTTGENSKESTDSTKEEIKTDIKADSLDELEDLVIKEVDKSVASLTEKYEQLKNDIDTYEKYKTNTDKIEEFYNDVYVSHHTLTLKLREYALSYAEIILSSDNSIDDKYDELEELYDNVYDDAGEDVYDEIYDGILEEIYDFYYDGILDKAYDTVPYKEWSDLRSDEYDWWSDTRSDVYDDWSDFRSDVYDFWSDMRSELWDDDIDKAMEKKEDFKDDITKLKDK